MFHVEHFFLQSFCRLSTGACVFFLECLKFLLSRKRFLRLGFFICLWRACPVALFCLLPFCSTWNIFSEGLRRSFFCLKIFRRAALGKSRVFCRGSFLRAPSDPLGHLLLLFRVEHFGAFPGPCSTWNKSPSFWRVFLAGVGSFPSVFCVSPFLRGFYRALNLFS